ncbi:MAG: hypothetical protein CSA26_07155 [Desulfobacterales bacterium]|nr:MAG: hypothetical protein CSA26_07155 [Desulfobacterales bacterium]
MARRGTQGAVKSVVVVGLGFMLVVGLIVKAASAQQRLPEDDGRVTDPKFEIGVFGASAYVPYYKGSSENRSFLLPLPYMVYRGEIIDLDEDSLTGRFFSSGRVVADVSLYAEINKSDDARLGMEELDEVMTAVGPAVKYYFSRKIDDGYDLYLSLPVRAAISGDWDDGLRLDYRGLQSKLILYYENFDLLPDKKLEFIASGAVGVMDSDLASYYYGVDAEDVTAVRHQYDASGGYAGASISLDLTYHLYDRFSIRAYTNVDYLGGAAFEDSPLVRETVNFAAGMALIYSIWQSEERVVRE